MQSRACSSLLVVIAVASVSMLGLGCGKEVGRIPLSNEGSGTMSAQVAAGKPLLLWTSVDVKWDGPDNTFGAIYEVEVEESGVTVAKGVCNPFDVNVKTSSKAVNIGSSHSLAYNGKLKCELAPTKAGPATIKATLKYTRRPASLTVKDLSLVLKE